MLNEIQGKLLSRSNTLAAACLVLAGHELLGEGRLEHVAVFVSGTVALTAVRLLRDALIRRRPASAEEEGAYDRVGDLEE